MSSPLWKWFRHHTDCRIYVGIDPGTTGAIGFAAWADPHEFLSCRTVDIPTFEVTRGRQKGKTFNHQAVIQLFDSKYLNPDRTWVTLEQSPVQVGPKVRYSDVILNRAYAMWPLFVLSKGFHLLEVTPGKWKKAMRLGKEKDDSRQKALKMFPKADILRKKDHNRAEALLLADYQRQIHAGVKGLE